MKRSLISDTVAYFFILLFLYTGIEKLKDVKSFREQLISSPILSSIAGFVAWALPITEILLAIVIFIPAWRKKGLWGSLILMSLFTVYLCTILIIDNHLSCSCGGIIENLSPRQHVLFNLAAILLAIMALFILKKPTLKLS